jgi:predicted permease
MQFAIAVAAAIAIIVVGLIVLFIAWRGYKRQKEWFPLILAICAFPVLILLVVLIIQGNL